MISCFNKNLNMFELKAIMIPAFRNLNGNEHVRINILTITWLLYTLCCISIIHVKTHVNIN